MARINGSNRQAASYNEGRAAPRQGAATDRYLRVRSMTPPTEVGDRTLAAAFLSAFGFLISLLDRFWPLAMVCSFARGHPADALAP